MKTVTCSLSYLDKKRQLSVLAMCLGAVYSLSAFAHETQQSFLSYVDKTFVPLILPEGQTASQDSIAIGKESAITGNNSIALGVNSTIGSCTGAIGDNATISNDA